MLQSIPSEAVFAAHGLHDVVLDLPPNIPPSVTHTLSYNTTPAHKTSNRISGWAKFRPVPAYPTFPTGRVLYDEVRLYLGPIGDPASMARFRRQAQLIALDTVPLPWTAPGTSAPVSADPSSSVLGPDARNAIKQEERYCVDNEVIAWWEDEHGLWLLTMMDRNTTQDLVDVWGGILGQGDVNHQVRQLVNGERKPQGKGKMSGNGMEACAEACEVLLRVVDCLMVCPPRVLRADERFCAERGYRSLHVDHIHLPYARGNRQRLSPSDSPTSLRYLDSLSHRSWPARRSPRRSCSSAIRWTPRPIL
jgi:hypothetical protein